MHLHTNKEDFEDLIKLTADHLEIPDVFVEKDYWVTMILKNIAESEFKDCVVFKGGTSLSKAHGLISRFSEDVDLALLCETGLSENQRKKKLKRIEQAATSGFTGAEQQAKDSGREPDSKGSKYRKTWWAYDRLSLAGEYGQAHPLLLLEINTFADPNPHGLMELRSFISEFLAAQDNSQAIEEYGLEPFEINVLSTKRTMAEKIMGLVRASYFCTDNDFSDLVKKIRHIYDIHHLMTKDEVVKSWLPTDEFISILETVHENDKSVHNKSADWCHGPLAEHAIFSDFSKVWPHLENTWKGDFKVLVHDEELPSQEALAECFTTLGQRLAEYDSQS
ncbi:nucleotidyl transferase AbiEii/AbiGii toxin family protein [Sansalvadorimonas sp. 2012CJ34-2]|uniref:Nucleotidyl transferase AbiEii/AbiGii toxin family protein n=1 Tax=Parendozoicomonas callyspongiae TaxID=2942213 RepID=A0ABT0PLD9_9GAMM|nr:nucleotidyl transferase AbiEii/AbiGii toxin family protein [Sansalvadorimonas sp. 2012CJ34-2]MCL6272199.1 nucleotidyl transferase AbiEii/AbiGii toxin family protein [Sansalvadorimonas sp. 2012CJ34-2]